MKRVDSSESFNHQHSYNNVSNSYKQEKESQSNTVIDKIDITSNKKNPETQIAVYKEPLLQSGKKQSMEEAYSPHIISKLKENEISDNLPRDLIKINTKLHDEIINYKPITRNISSDINIKLDSTVLGKENNVHSAQSNVQEIINLVFSDHDNFDKVYDRSILVLGNTGSGKSTLVNYLAQAPLFAVDDDGEIKIHCNEDKEIVRIGHTSESTTILPQKWIANDGTVFWDCPGFKDNRSVVLDVANSFYRTNIIGKSKSIKLMLLMPYADTKGRANGLMDFVQTIDDLFYGEANKYANACALVITKVPQEVSVNNIQARLFKMSDNMSDPQKDMVGQLIKNISIFNEPGIDEDLSKDEFGFNRKEILENLYKTNCLSEGAPINSAPSNKSMLEIVKWYQDITNDALARFKETNKGFISDFGEKSFSKNFLNDILHICDELNSKFESINIEGFNLESFVENVKSLDECLSKAYKKYSKINYIGADPTKFIDHEKFLPNSVQKQITFLEDFFLQPAITLTFRSELLREFKHFLTDLKFEASITLDPNRFNELQAQARSSHANHEGVHYTFYENTIKMVQENKIAVGAGVTLSTGIGTGIGMAIAHGAAAGLAGGPIGLVVGGFIGVCYAVYKYCNTSNSNSN